MVSDLADLAGTLVVPPRQPDHRIRSGPVPALADGFTDRAESVPGLAAALVAGSIVVLAPAQTGDLSRGKTQLAVLAAESMWQAGRVDVLVWVTAVDRASLLAGYAEAAAALGVTVPGDGEATAGRLVRWLAETSRRWLVVLDDLRDQADVDGLWPGGPAGTVLVTSSNAAIADGRDGAVIVPVGVFSRREALAYLAAGLRADPDQRLGAIDLADDLGYEPVALAQAAGLIRYSGSSCRDYRLRLASMRDQLTDATGTEPHPVAVTCRLAIEQAGAVQHDSAAQALLTLLAVMAGEAIPSDVFATEAVRGYLLSVGTAPEQDSVQNVLLDLEELALISIDRTPTPVIRVNMAVAAVVSGTVPAGLRRLAVLAVVDALLEAWPVPEPDPWQAATLRSCAASLLQHVGDVLCAGRCHPLLLHAGQSLAQAGLRGPAVAYWYALAAATEKRPGPDVPVIRRQLAEACLANGDAGKAVTWFQLALAALPRLPPLHPDVTCTRIGLGQALAAAGLASDAITVLRSAAQHAVQASGPDSRQALTAREALAAAHLAAGQPARAVRLYRDALAVRLRVHGSQHPATLATRHQLAEACLAAGQSCNALAQASKATAGRERLLGSGHPDTVASRASLAAACLAAGRVAAAVQLHEQAAGDSARVLGPDHPLTLARRANLAGACYQAGRITDAHAILRDALARCERTLPPGDPLTVAVRQSLANIGGDTATG
jgi:tetratricopeptide (TPR) repeat protein